VTEQLVLGGKRADAAEGETFDVVEPSTGRPMQLVAKAGPEDAKRAVDIAHEAFEDGDWRRATARQRGHVLLRAAELIRERSEDLARLEARNAGKPISAARGEISLVANVFEYWGGAPTKILGETVPIAQPGIDLTLREPVGVCALITPWNFPAVIASWKLAPALACGNTAVLKPASQTPLTALEVADVLAEAGLPEGTLSVLPGPGSTVATALISDPRVSKIGFTGSTEVGRQVMQTAAQNIARVSLELGGKSANVVFADADLDEAVEPSLWSVFDNAGQDCCSRSRQFVQRLVYDEFVERFAKRAESVVLGAPLDEETEMGPLISAGQRQTSLDYLQIGESEGARRVTGGVVPEGDGFYLRPAVLADVDNSSRVAQEEIFGPVVTVIPFEDEKDAIRIANESRYGLMATVWTGDPARGHRLARRIKAGTVGINMPYTAFPGIPFGGYKQSGFGRELGLETLDSYLETKSVIVSTSPKPFNPFGL
jgi:acyl-CoA reductase-like NAD-dependent aldehyde dehydrogenase